PLLNLRRTVPADDTHLLYVVRMALRNQLLPAETWARLAYASWSEREIADVAAGAPTPEAASFLLKHLHNLPGEGTENRIRYTHHISRYGTTEAVQELLEFLRTGRSPDLREQAGIFRAVQQGTQERGAKLNQGALQ